MCGEGSGPWRRTEPRRPGLGRSLSVCLCPRLRCSPRFNTPWPTWRTLQTHAVLRSALAARPLAHSPSHSHAAPAACAEPRPGGPAGGGGRGGRESTGRDGVSALRWEPSISNLVSKSSSVKTNWNPSLQHPKHYISSNKVTIKKHKDHYGF